VRVRFGLAEQHGHPIGQVKHAQQDGGRREPRGTQDLMDPFAERSWHHSAGRDEAQGRIADEVGHDVHIVVKLGRDTTDRFLFLGGLTDALTILLGALLVQGSVCHGVTWLDAHRRKDSGSGRVIEGARRWEAGRECIAQVRAGLREHGWHSHGELTIAVCKVVDIILADCRLGSIAIVLLLVRWSSTGSVVAGHKLWGCEQLARNLLAWVEGRHDDVALSQEDGKDWGASTVFSSDRLGVASLRSVMRSGKSRRLRSCTTIAEGGVFFLGKGGSASKRRGDVVKTGLGRTLQWRSVASALLASLLVRSGMGPKTRLGVYVGGEV